MAIRSFENHHPNIADSAFIDAMALVVGEVEIGEDSSLWPMAVARGDVQRIIIGKRTNIQDGTVLHVTHDSSYEPGGTPLILGDDITVGHRVVLHACTIDDLCLVGMGSVVLDGAHLKSGVFLGANSLVPPHKVLEPGLWLGNPAKRIRDLSPEEYAFLSYSAAHYVALAHRHQG